MRIRALLVGVALLAGVAACAGAAWQASGTWRYLFVRNALPDTAYVVAFSFEDRAHVLRLSVAPNDSACARFPFLDTRATVLVRAGSQQQAFAVDIHEAGLDWLLLGSAELPALDVCVALAPPLK